MDFFKKNWPPIVAYIVAATLIIYHILTTA